MSPFLIPSTWPFLMMLSGKAMRLVIASPKNAPCGRVGCQRVARLNTFPTAPLQTNHECKVGCQRVALTGTFPTAPSRTDHDRFRINQLSSDISERSSNDAQYCIGSPHHAYLTALFIKSPVPLCPANGSPVLPGGASFPRLLLELRHLRTRVP
jgi:hypothetical protein